MKIIDFDSFMINWRDLKVVDKYFFFTKHEAPVRATGFSWGWKTPRKTNKLLVN